MHGCSAGRHATKYRAPCDATFMHHKGGVSTRASTCVEADLALAQRAERRVRRQGSPRGRLLIRQARHLAPATGLLRHPFPVHQGACVRAAHERSTDCLPRSTIKPQQTSLPAGALCLPQLSKQCPAPQLLHANPCSAVLLARKPLTIISAPPGLAHEAFPPAHNLYVFI